jgi:hypothetical protein
LRSASIIIIPSSVSAQPISTGLLRQNPTGHLLPPAKQVPSGRSRSQRR